MDSHDEIEDYTPPDDSADNMHGQFMELQTVKSEQ